MTKIVEALGGPSAPELCDSQYSQYFLLRGQPRGSVSLTRTTYGAPDAADATCASMQGTR